MSKHRIVVFRKYDGVDGPTCDFAYQDVESGEAASPNWSGRIPGRIGELVNGFLGGEPTGAQVHQSDVAAFSRDARMVEVWRRPSAFKAERLNGRVINGYTYRWRSSISDVLGEGD